MNELFFARSQIGMSLPFHTVFPVIGMAMPLPMAIAAGCYLWRIVAEEVAKLQPTSPQKSHDGRSYELIAGSEGSEQENLNRRKQRKQR